MAKTPEYGPNDHPDGETTPVWGGDENGDSVVIGHTHESWGEQVDCGQHSWHQVNPDGSETEHTYNDNDRM